MSSASLYHLKAKRLSSRLSELKKSYDQDFGKLSALTQERDSIVAATKNLKQENQSLEETRLLLQKVGNEARETARQRLQETVTDALRHVFGSDFEFIIELEERRGRVEAEFYVQSEYNGEIIKRRPEDSRGGGVIDIIAIALRVALLQIHNDPTIRGPIILDEPGKHVSADYTMKLAEFLKQINQTFNRQIIISTHQQDLAQIADRTIEVEIKGGKSHVTIRQEEERH